MGIHVDRAVWEAESQRLALLELTIATCLIDRPKRFPKRKRAGVQLPGRLRSGDLATMNAQGYVNIVGA